MSNQPTMPLSPPMHAAVAPGGAVDSDLACRKCAYNLRGLTLAGRCPECGTAVGYSAQGDLLRFSDPNWVDKLRLGVNLTIAAVVVAIFGAVAAALAGSAVSGAQLSRMSMVWLVVINGLVLAGAWLLTTPDPSGLGEDQYGTSRRLIRTTLFVSLADTMIQALPTAIPISEPVEGAMRVINLIAQLAGYVGLLAQLRYYGKLNLRIPDLKLAGRSNFLFWAIGITYGTTLLGQIATELAGKALGSTPLLALLAVPVAVASLSLLVFMVMYLLLIEKMGKRFKEQASSARQSWAAATVNS